MAQNKQLVVRATDYTLIIGKLYKMGPDEVLQICVNDHEWSMLLAEVHSGVVGGHYAGAAIVEKILRVGLWWPMIYQDSKAHWKAYDVCQRVGKPSKRDEMLMPQVTSHAFAKWVVDFVKPINPLVKQSGVRYIITNTEYLTRWAEA